MSRKNKNARRNWTRRYSFTEICNKIGVKPRQRLIIRRFILKGGDNHE
jgi:hypothetical protein